MAPPPEQPRLSAEERRALEIPVAAGQDGATDPLMLANGFGREMLAGLVLAGARTVMTEITLDLDCRTARSRYRIPDDARRAIEG
jgi:hypothetical protein